MEILGRYIMSVTAAAILFSILQSLFNKKSSMALLVRMIGALFLTFTVIAPFWEIDLSSIFDIQVNYSEDGHTIATQGAKLAREQLCSNIKEKTEAYISDKAMSLETPMDVDIILSQDEIPVPSTVRLTGQVSPFVKNTMQVWIQNEIGIPKEHQIWNG